MPLDSINKIREGYLIMKTTIITIYLASSSLQPVRTPGLDCEWGGNDVLDVADCKILQKAPRGPLLEKQLLCVLNVIILCLHSLQIVCYEWKERRSRLLANIEPQALVTQRWLHCCTQKQSISIGSLLQCKMST